jgi:hypothetical protein
MSLITQFDRWESFYNKFNLVITPTYTAQSGALFFVSQKGTGITNVQPPVENALYRARWASRNDKKYLISSRIGEDTVVRLRIIVHLVIRELPPPF